LNTPARPAHESRRSLRRALRQRRAALHPATRAAAARLIAAHIARTSWLKAGSAIGLYAHRGPEVATTTLRALARQRACRLYLPRITSYAAHTMTFTRATDAPLLRNRLGVDEPAAGATLGARWLAVVFLPLLGFDDTGTRLGSGAGYYDRLLAMRCWRPAPPLLVGLGFDAQRCARLERGVHDVPLDAVVTESGIQFFTKER
jgi:5-formyltetrahydrofolate cyclo-ligase